MDELDEDSSVDALPSANNNNNDTDIDIDDDVDELNTNNNGNGMETTLLQQQEQEQLILQKRKQNRNNSNLFDYTQDELLVDQCLTYYEILNVAVHATPDQIKKAYRKCSLKYHPDKTGRGDDDYVFLAVKAAYDTLLDPTKRQGYDSTILPFDDTIPPPRSILIQDAIRQYTDDDFYELYEPVFQRNLRFDARLRPDLNNNNNKNGNTNNKKPSKFGKSGDSPPILGDASTTIEHVHSFYEYWIHFESWRDFSAQAADELQVENELENAESRFEKRWIQKEIDRRARQLKRTEMARIQTLVERAMEADPRLRQHRQNQIAAKEQAAADRERALEAQRAAAIAAAEQAAADEIALKEQRAAEKLVREKEKKLLRKARQTLRKQTSSSFETYMSSNNNNYTTTSSSSSSTDTGAPSLWNDAYDMNQDVEYLCTNLTLEELNQLNEDFETSGLDLVYQLTLERKTAAQEQEQQVRVNNMNNETTKANGGGGGKTAQLPWTAMELSALAKAVKKYPAGGASRWDAITLFVNNMCRPDIPRSREACIEKYNQIARVNNNNNNTTAVESASPTSTTAATPVTVERNGTVVSPESDVTNGHHETNANATSKPMTTSDGTNDATTATPSTDTTNWTPEQDKLLQDALSKYPATMDKNERWSAIAAAVPGQTKKSCVQRFKSIREALLLQKTNKK